VFLIHHSGTRSKATTVLNRNGISTPESLKTQFLRYLVAGGTAFIVDFGALVLLTDLLDIHYLVSAAIAFGCGLVTNYLLSIIWVFSVRSMTNKTAEFVIFAVIGLIGLGWNELLLYAGTEGLGLDYRISKLVSVAVVLIWNFGMRRLILFTRAGK
jgi:putative flippase GtrA